MRRREGPHRFIQKRPPTFVSALQRVSAVETSKNQLSRDFRCCSIFRLLQQYRHFSDVTTGRRMSAVGRRGSRDCVARLPSLTRSGRSPVALLNIKTTLAFGTKKLRACSQNWDLRD